MSGVAKVYSVAPIGFEGSLIEVESDMKNGLPSLQVVGLGNKAIDEARERIRSAITNSLLEFPAKKFIINLAPAELPKDGSHYDLPMALSILTASKQLRHEEVANAVFAGELALDGTLRPVRAVISIAETARKNGIATLYVPEKNVEQAQLVEDLTIYAVKNLKELFLHLKGESKLTPASPVVTSSKPSISAALLDDIIGQEQAKRALTIAAAGRHNILFTGPPGAGKTMLARTLTSLLPALTKRETVEVTKLYSLSGESIDEIIVQRPFRSPHHTSSRVALIGGGTRIVPGEISLAHHGVLFLDEIPEYPRSTLESLRQPLEDRKVSISRASSRVDFPADFMLVATMNPCPCGYFGDTTRECTCSSIQIINYQKRLSGPLLDRIDMVVNVARVESNKLLHQNTLSEKQHTYAKNCIQNALKLQSLRYSCSSKYNANASSRDIKSKLAITDDARKLLDQASDTLQLSARSYFKTAKVARTIADMEGSELTAKNHIAEALQYRHVTS
jgi:magnesium chelatase family protein